MSAAGGDSSRILMKLPQIDHRAANQLISNHQALCERQESRKYKQPSSSSSSCPVLSRAPASCFARCCAPTLKSRRNPVRRSAVGTPESQGAERGRGGEEGSLTTSGPDLTRRRSLLIIPTGEAKLVYLTGKSQPARTGQTA